MSAGDRSEGKNKEVDNPQGISSRREDSDPAPFLREAVPGDAGPDRVKPHSPPLSTLTLGLVYRNISVGSLRELAPLPGSCPPAKGASPQISTLIRYLRCY